MIENFSLLLHTLANVYDEFWFEMTLATTKLGTFKWLLMKKKSELIFLNPFFEIKVFLYLFHVGDMYTSRRCTVKNKTLHRDDELLLIINIYHFLTTAGLFFQKCD